MGNKEYEEMFSAEEFEIISSQKCIDFYTERHNVLGKFLSFMHGSCE